MWNKNKYFKSEAWNSICYHCAQDIKMVQALNDCMRGYLKRYAFDINYSCSLETFQEAELKPVSAICKLLNLSDAQQAFKYFDDMEEAYRILYKEHALVKNKLKFVSCIKHKIPFWINIVTLDIHEYLGLNNLIEQIPKPTFKFRYCNPAGCNKSHTIVMNIKTISTFKQEVLLLNKK